MRECVCVRVCTYVRARACVRACVCMLFCFVSFLLFCLNFVIVLKRYKHAVAAWTLWRSTTCTRDHHLTQFSSSPCSTCGVRGGCSPTTCALLLATSLLCSGVGYFAGLFTSSMAPQRASPHPSPSLHRNQRSWRTKFADYGMKVTVLVQMAFYLIAVFFCFFLFFCFCFCFVVVLFPLFIFYFYLSFLFFFYFDIALPTFVLASSVNPSFD